MSNPEFADVIAEGIIDDSNTSPNPGERESARWKILAKKGPFAVAADRCDVWAGNTRDVQVLASGSFDELIESLKSVGQQMPVIARISPADPARLQIIAGACRHTAISRINEDRPAEDRMPIIVDLRDVDDATAFKIVDAENRGRSELAPIEKARLYQRAITSVYHTESALADAFGLNKSTVNRTLAILRLPQDITALIKNPHGISAAQASQFMADWNLPELHEMLVEAIVDLTAKGPASATTVFKALRDAVKTPSPSGAVPILNDDARIGSVRRGKGGGVVIELSADARSLGWKCVAQATGVALKQLAKASEQ